MATDAPVIASLRRARILFIVLVALPAGCGQPSLSVETHSRPSASTTSSLGVSEVHRLGDDTLLLTVEGTLYALSPIELRRLDRCGDRIQLVHPLSEHRVFTVGDRGDRCDLSAPTTEELVERSEEALSVPALLRSPRRAVVHTEHDVWIIGAEAVERRRSEPRIARLYRAPDGEGFALRTELGLSFERPRSPALELPEEQLPWLVHALDWRGRFVALVGDGVRLFDAQTQQTLLHEPARDMETLVALSPDTRLLATADMELLRVYSTADGRELWRQSPHGAAAPTGLAWANGTLVVTWWWGAARFGASHGETLGWLRLDRASALALSPDGAHLAACVPSRRGLPDQLVLSPLLSGRVGPQYRELELPDGACAGASITWLSPDQLAVHATGLLLASLDAPPVRVELLRAAEQVILEIDGENVATLSPGHDTTELTRLSLLLHPTERPNVHHRTSNTARSMWVVSRRGHPPR